MRFFKDLKRYSRFLIFSVRSQLKSEVTNSYLDWLWWILEPFCTMLVYAFIFGVAFHAKEDYFPIFIFIGLSMWNFFNRVLEASVKLVRNNKDIVSRVYIPKQMLLLKNMGVNGFKMLVSFGVVIAMLLFYRVPVNICVVYVIPVLIDLFIFTYGIGCFLMHFGVYVEDLGYIVTIILRMLMYLTGIFYSIEKRLPAPYNALALKINPVASLIHIMREALLYRHGSAELPLLMWLAVGVVISAAGTALIYKSENSYVKVI